MQKVFILVVGFGVLVYVLQKASRDGAGRFGWFHRLTGWQKFFGVVALLAAFVVMLNPEFLALGLFGDTVFFDFLVMALSAQFYGWFAGGFRKARLVLKQVMRWLGVPSPGLLYLLAVVAVLANDIGAALQKAWQRIIS